MQQGKKIFGIAGLFDNSDAIVLAAEKVSELGYKKYDAHTPYPVHGMDNAMKLKPSKLGFVTLVFGLSGTAAALFFTWWTMSLNYPINIGGKPFFAFPAFVPVIFETTVLLATLATVAGMFAFFFNLPYNAHPLHDTNYMKKVSLDKFGICIEAADPKFDIIKIKNLFNELGAQEIEEIFYIEKEKIPFIDIKFILFLSVTAILVSGATYLILNKVLYTVPFDWMMSQQKVNVQFQSSFFSDEFGMRTPVQGTVARGHLPYAYAGMKEPSLPLPNPLQLSEKVLKLGKKKYNTFCSPCHGNFGEGDSRLRDQFPKPPTLHSTKVREWKDGNIFHVISNGQNIMPAYGSQISVDERWAIVQYIRVLQRAKNAEESDLAEIKKESSSNAAK